MLGLWLLSQGGSQVPQPERHGSGLLSVRDCYLTCVWHSVRPQNSHQSSQALGMLCFPQPLIIFGHGPTSCSAMKWLRNAIPLIQARERGPRRKSSCVLRVWDSDTDLFEQWWLDSHVSKSLMSTYYTLIHIFRPHSLTLFDLLSWNASGDRGV